MSFVIKFPPPDNVCTDYDPDIAFDDYDLDEIERDLHRDLEEDRQAAEEYARATNDPVMLTHIAHLRKFCTPPRVRAAPDVSRMSPAQAVDYAHTMALKASRREWYNAKRQAHRENGRRGDCVSYQDFVSYLDTFERHDRQRIGSGLASDTYAMSLLFARYKQERPHALPPPRFLQAPKERTPKPRTDIANFFAERSFEEKAAADRYDVFMRTRPPRHEWAQLYYSVVPTTPTLADLMSDFATHLARKPHDGVNRPPMLQTMTDSLAPVLGKRDGEPVSGDHTVSPVTVAQVCQTIPYRPTPMSWESFDTDPKYNPAGNRFPVRPSLPNVPHSGSSWAEACEHTNPPCSSCVRDRVLKRVLSGVGQPFTLMVPPAVVPCTPLEVSANVMHVGGPVSGAPPSEGDHPIPVFPVLDMTGASAPVERELPRVFAEGADGEEVALNMVLGCGVAHKHCEDGHTLNAYASELLKGDVTTVSCRVLVGRAERFMAKSTVHYGICSVVTLHRLARHHDYGPYSELASTGRVLAVLNASWPWWHDTIRKPDRRKLDHTSFNGEWMRLRDVIATVSCDALLPIAVRARGDVTLWIVGSVPLKRLTGDPGGPRYWLQPSYVITVRDGIHSMLSVTPPVSFNPPVVDLTDGWRGSQSYLRRSTN
jgi:hypothetical protein